MLLCKGLCLYLDDGAKTSIYFIDASLSNDPEVDNSWCILPPNLTSIHFSIKGNLWAFPRALCRQQNISCAKKKQADIVNTVPILCLIHYRQLVTWKFIKLFTNTFSPAQRAYFGARQSNGNRYIWSPRLNGPSVSPVINRKIIYCPFSTLTF